MRVGRRCRESKTIRAPPVAAGVVRRARRGPAPGPDLVEERERARVALEGDAHEVAHRRLDLALDRLGQAQRGDRLDVQALVGLEQLERLEREAGPVRAAARGSARTARRPAAGPSGTSRSASSIRSHSTQRSTSGRCPSSSARCISYQRATRPGRHAGVEQLVGAAQQRVQRLGGVALLERAVGQLGEVPGGRGALEAVAEREPGVPDADLGDDVEGPAAGERDAQLGERLERCRRGATSAGGSPLAMALSLPSLRA